ncbi:MAG: diguanylate cyclase [Arcobacteraceae bacterium]|nr:diguanylate cyclase [Arcobacteraceae bacterium]
MNQQNFRKVFTVYFIIFGVLVTLFASFVSYQIQIINIEETLEKQAQEILFIQRNNILQPAIKQMDNIAITLANNPVLSDYILNPDELKRKNLEEIFFAVSGTNNQIMQVRFIDKNGIENIRVDRQTEESLPFVVSREKLQDKSNRDYFQIVSKMNSQELWHSKIDLNIENGKIEVPYRPTFRIAMPIFKNQTFEGMVIVNLLTNNLIKSIQSSTVFKHYIIDKDGFFIVHHDNQFSWNKYTGVNRSLTDDFPNDASLILTGGLIGKEFFAYPLDDVFQNDDNAILVLKPKQEYKTYLIHEKIKSSVVVVILSIILSILMALYASSVPSKLQKALFVANDELKRFAKIIDKYVITATTKTNTTITHISSAFSKSSGYTKDELMGEKINVVRHPDTDKKIFEDIWKTLGNGEEWCGEIKNKKKDGEEYWLEQNIIPIKDEKEDTVAYMSIGVDISAKKQLEILSSTDMLTGIFNRRKIEELLNIEISRAKRHKRALSVIILDIDHFKHTNDTFGHHAGDIVLQKTVQVINQALRQSDMFGRYGGEEFLIICPETNKDEAVIVAEKVRHAIEEFTFEIVGKKTISLGIAEFKDDDTLEVLVKNADVALYSSKENGRNQVTVYFN